MTKGVLAKRKAMDLFSKGSSAKSRKKTRQGKMNQAIANEKIKPLLLQQVKPKSKLFTGYSFLVIYGDDDKIDGNEIWDKFETEQKIVENGGQVLHSPPQKTDNIFIIVSGRDNGVRIKNYQALETFDIIKSDWLKESIKEGSLVELEPR